MLPEEKFRIFAFLIIVLGVYVLTAWISFRWILEKIKVVSPSFSRGWFRFKKTIWFLAIAGFICFLYGLWVEPYWPSVSFVQIKSAKLEQNSQPIRVVQISDLHSDPKPRLENRLPNLIKSLKPDIIVFTGDCVNSPRGLHVFKACLKQISAIAPTYVVKGNWDVNFWYELDLFGGSDVTELDGEIKKVQIGNNTLSVGGAAADMENDLGKLAQKFVEESFNILLYHYPLVLEPQDQRKVDLVLAGHVHGGQVALPFYGAIITLSKYGKRYEAGLYRTGETWLYVNRGIGMEGGLAPRVRFFARPEITVIEIAPL